jgi:ribonuclease Z
MEKIHEHQIPVSALQQIKAGKDYIGENGKLIPNEDLTLDSALPRSFAFISDTKYDEYLVEDIKGVDLLYHEATFMEDMAERAEATFHSTGKQAAKIAHIAEVGKLLIGHFSARYRDLEPLLEETKSVFQNTELATEGSIFEIPVKKST